MLASGLFDRTYYEIQTGTTFGSDEEAARDFLQQGHRLGLSPHPLFEPEWFGRERPRSRRNTLIAYLDEGGGEHGPGPLFAEQAYLAQVPEARRHPGGALGHFVARAGDDDRLPVPTDRRTTPPTWAEARRSAYETAREFRRFEDLRSTPRRGPWDEAADRRFVAEWLGRARAARSDGLPSVSVVMPVRNRPRQVQEAIASVQGQTLTDWELIVVDDGSTDETPDVVEGVAAADPRIRLLRQDPAGVSAARNAGIDAATGEWLAFLDSDNMWVPPFLEVMLGYLEDTGSSAGHAVIDTMVEPTEPGSGRYLAFEGGLDHLLVRNHIDLNGFMVRTGTAIEAGRFDESLRRWVDHDLVIRVARLTDIPRVPFVGVRYDHDPAAVDRITTTEPNAWELVVLDKNLVDWEAVVARSGARRTDLTSICVVAVDWVDSQLAIDSVLGSADLAETAIEVVVVVNGGRRCVRAILGALYDSDARVRIVSLPRNLDFAIGANVAFAASSGGRVVFLDADTEVLPGWLRPMLDALDDHEVLGCQALLLDGDGSVQCAGWAFSGLPALPSPLLAGHSVDDARAAAPLALPAVSASALAMRAEDVIALRGFDPWFAHGYADVDLCLRAVDGGSRRFRVATDAVVIHHRRRSLPDDHEHESRRSWMSRWAADAPPSDLGVLARLGYHVAHLTPGSPVSDPGDVRIPAPVVVRPHTSVDGSGEPRLRWAVKTPVPLRQEGSPDLELADGVAEALRRLGQDVVVDRLETHQRASCYLDDVVLLLCRATLPVDQPGAVNLAWLLGPVTPDALAGVRLDSVLVLTVAGPLLLEPGALDADQWSGSDALPGPDQLGGIASLLLRRAVEIRRRRAAH